MRYLYEKYCPVRLSVTKFSQDWLVFSDIVQDWLLTMISSDRQSQIFEKKIGGPNSDPKLGFLYHFLRLGSLVYLEIVYNDSLQQGLPPSEGKIREKKFEVPNLG